MNSFDDTKHPGFIAIDFGTSSSTVSVFEPKIAMMEEDIPPNTIELLSSKLKDFLLSGNIPGNTNSSSWSTFIKDLNYNLKQVSQKNIKTLLNSPSTINILELVKQIEVYLWINSDLRNSIGSELVKIYDEVFNLPFFEKQNIAIFNLDKQQSDQLKISSEIEITGVNQEKIDIEMGFQVPLKRLSLIAKLSKENSVDWNIITSKFHPSPKRYLLKKSNETFKYYQGSLPADEENNSDNENISTDIKYQDLLDSAWSKLIDLASLSRDRDPETFSKGKFDTAVVTYPTVASPHVRNELRELTTRFGLKK